MPEKRWLLAACSRSALWGGGCTALYCSGRLPQLGRLVEQSAVAAGVFAAVLLVLAICRYWMLFQEDLRGCTDLRFRQCAPVLLRACMLTWVTAFLWLGGAVSDITTASVVWCFLWSGSVALAAQGFLALMQTLLQRIHWR